MADVRMALKQVRIDKAALRGLTERIVNRLLSKFGGYTRRIARNSMKSKKGTADAGAPPFAHTKFLKEAILYAVDKEAGSVVIGPVKRSAKYADIPALLESGGHALRNVGRPVDTPRGLIWVDVQPRDVEYAPHPFMGPAFEKSLEKLPKFLRDSSGQ